MKYKIVSKIAEKGYPTASKNYPEAHSEADVKEKNNYPKGYEKLKKVEKKMKSNTLEGTHTSSGKIKISKIVPNKLRKEVASHEKYELAAQKRLAKRK